MTQSKADDAPSLPRRRFLQAGGGAAMAALVARFDGARQAFAQDLAAEPPTATGAVLRPLYSLDAGVTYLNHASIGTMPRAVQTAHRRYLEICEGNPWLHMWGDAWVEPVAAVRAQCGQFLGCSAEEVTFSHNTTETFNLLAQGLPLGPGDEVLFSSLNHSGASVCWQHQAKTRGFSVRRFAFPLDEVVDLTEERLVDLYRQAIRPQTKVLVLPHVDNMVGIRHPLAPLAKAAKEEGVRWVAVDGAQTAGMFPFQLADTGVDIYATSAHKWLQAPKGLGVAFLGREIQQTLRPMWVTWGQASWTGSVRIFEDYGTRNLASILALGDALEFGRRLPDAARQGHHRHLWQTTQDLVAARDDLSWCSPRRWQLAAPLFAVGIEGDVRQTARQLFAEHGIVVRPFDKDGLNSLRLSPNVANTAEEIERTLSLC